MSATSPEDICRLFKQYMAAGDLESVLSVYDSEAVFLQESGEPTEGRAALRRQLAPLVATHSRFDFDIRKVVRAGDIALMHTKWKISGPQPMSVYAIEVAQRQTDGTWCWLIGDPYTVGRERDS